MVLVMRLGAYHATTVGIAQNAPQERTRARAVHNCGSSSMGAGSFRPG